MKDLEILMLCSEMAKKHGGNYELVEICDSLELKVHDLTFHPNGNCGCILLDDAYAFGIRCDHLMWAEGNCEGVEGFWTDDDHKIADEKLGRKEHNIYNAILVYGNHKGGLFVNLLVFHETRVES